MKKRSKNHRNLTPMGTMRNRERELNCVEERVDVMTDFQFKALMEMVKDIVRELKDPDKIIERIEQIQDGEFGKKQK